MDKVTTSDYILGHSDAELERLIEQSRINADLTSQFLTSIGLRPGHECTRRRLWRWRCLIYCRKLGGPFRH